MCQNNKIRRQRKIKMILKLSKHIAKVKLYNILMTTEMKLRFIMNNCLGNGFNYEANRQVSKTLKCDLNFVAT